MSSRATETSGRKRAGGAGRTGGAGWIRRAGRTFGAGRTRRAGRTGGAGRTRGAAAAAAAIAALAACVDGVTPDFDAVIGYATVTGTIARASGEPFSGSVEVRCGLQAPDFFWNEHPASGGEYRAELIWPNMPMQGSLEDNDWTGVCRVSAPAGNSPFASAEAPVVFAPTEEERVETRIDLVEEEEGP